MENLFLFYFVLLLSTYICSWFNYFVLDLLPFEVNEKRDKLTIVEGIIVMAYFVQNYECFVHYKAVLLNIFVFLIVAEAAHLLLKKELMTDKEFTMLYMQTLIVSFIVLLYNLS